MSLGSFLVAKLLYTSPGLLVVNVVVGGSGRKTDGVVAYVAGLVTVNGVVDGGGVEDFSKFTLYFV